MIGVGVRRTGVGRIVGFGFGSMDCFGRFVGSIVFDFGLVEGLVAGRRLRGILGLGFGLVARGLGSVIVGRRGY
jgi:hypothetical protein